MLISFWSIHHGQAATTTNMLSISLALSLSSNSKVLVSHTQYGETRLEDSLVSDVKIYKDSVISGYGIEQLIRLQKNGLLHTDNFSDYTIPLLKNNRYDLLIGTDQHHLEEEELLIYEETLLNVLSLSMSTYDYVFVDIASGTQNKLSQKILDMSDVVVINTSQNTYSIEKLIQSDIVQKDKKTMYCIGKYEDSIKTSKKNLIRKYRFNNIITVPYSPILIDIINRGEMLDYFGRNISLSKKSKSPFFSEVLKSAEKLESHCLKR